MDRLWRRVLLGFLLYNGGLALAACSASDASSPAGGSGTGGGAGSLGGGPGGGAAGAAASGSGGSGGGFATGGRATGGGTGSGGASGAVGTGGATGGPCSSPPPNDTPADEQCGNGLDDDLDGFIDENCACARTTTQPCFDGPPSLASSANCTIGTQTCEGTDEFPAWGVCGGSGCSAAPPPPELCDTGADEDCDGLVDEGCFLDVTVNIDGDCIGIPCPPQAPYPIGCQIVMEGDDSRGCVAHTPGNPAVYFQEGNACPVVIGGIPIGGAGHISGTLLCSSQPLPAPAPGMTDLDMMNCNINKAEAIYALDPSGCPQP